MTKDHQLPLDAAAGFVLWRAFVLRSAGFPVALATTLDSEAAATAARVLMDATARHEALVKEVKRELLVRERELSGTPRAMLRRLSKKLGTGGPFERLPALDDDLHGRIELLVEHRRAADRARVSFESVFASEMERLTAALQAAVRNGRVREAIAWESPSALEGIDKFLERPAGKLDKKGRMRFYRAVSYLQRLCVKNDTIGFFGPLAWGSFSEDVADIEIETPEPLIRRHEHYFEAWAVNNLSRRIGEQPDSKSWIAVRRLPSVALSPDTVKFPMQPPQERSRAVTRTLELSDGSRNSREIIAELVGAELMSAEEARALLDSLENEGLLFRTAELPLSYASEQALSELLRQMPDDVAEPHRSRLGRICDARRELAAACGDGDKVRDAIAHVQQVFADETGQPGRRGTGTFYEARSPVFQEAERNMRIRLGRRVLDDLRPPLSAVMRVVRWFTRTFATRLEERVATILTRMGVARVEFLPIFFEVLGELPSLARGAGDEMRQRWAEAILPLARDGAIDTATAQAAIARFFPFSEASWELARHASPDLLIGASDLDAIRHGDYFVVLGELHAAANTLLQSCFAWAHDPELLAEWTRRDVTAPPVIGDWQEPLSTVRAARVEGVYGASWLLPHHRTNVRWSNENLVPLASLYVERADSGALSGRCMRSERQWSIVELFNPVSCVAACNAFRFVEAQPHSQRLSIDRLVVQREQWVVGTQELAFVHAKQPAERFAQLVAWSRQKQIPRHIFIKLQSEMKPLYFDLESPLYGELFAKFVRKPAAENATVTISEMLPRPDQLWLTDPRGNRYTTELRCVAVDTA